MLHSKANFANCHVKLDRGDQWGKPHNNTDHAWSVLDDRQKMLNNNA